MFKTMIEYCTSNAHHGTVDIMQKFEQEDRYEITEYGCLGNCGECYLKPFALVEGEIVAVDSIDELYGKIHEAIIRQETDRELLDKLLDDL
ncbi:Uncharacterized protein YuzB, UPF0349 family [Paenibacillus algorifonticola]|uniref:Uncharacterized protein YuzB, UPF0349 family n=1 Tax=Paenibacillus algorifonticola TaxID=684063 RepID=A0A1I2HKB6_9BACL|nr:YuzB family protein [Paenibacillus algorifonticola]SFF30604.1 Uncharacterized protein YuzB, UPF0349 family [Paenibacillus algorifonticola]